MTVKGPYEFLRRWIGLDADTRPTNASVGDGYFISDVGTWERYTGFSWVEVPSGVTMLYFDNTVWEPGDWGGFGTDEGTWDGSAWDSTNNGTPPQTHAIALEPIGGWETGFRPAKMRITFTGNANLNVVLKHSGGNVYSNGVYTSESEATLSWSGNDLIRLDMSNNNDNTFEVTNIEFYD